ncbi:glutathione S-transferase N-terminal domain-containing protein [Halobacteriovorax sp. HLS]|uniref:glutaredoxin family protein n=1 Tax=Halobacteriovorax sp. HLS TaxID=2234000 RepID=UPI000FD6BD73|nr:glutathione S-transferase N-terminal domain-containing protein [Halobacteriovorax sp. HLS]
MYQKLELFYYDACPFCQYVLGTINKLNVKVDLCNIQEDQKCYERLVQDTGRRTVPCLYIDNKAMFESSDIMQWLEDNQEKLEKN